MDACTNNYGAIVTANNLTTSNDICDSVFWIRAPLNVPTVKLGHPSVWAMDSAAYEDRELEEGTTNTLKSRGYLTLRNSTLHHVGTNLY